MKIHFIGCVEIGHTVLSALIGGGWKVDTIWTIAPELAEKTSGYIDFAPLAKQSGAKLMSVRNINAPETIEEMRQSAPDLIIVCGWQRLLSDEILQIPPKKTVGFHSSLLPKYRGRAPVNWAILMGEKETGVTMFYLDPEADTGDIIGQRAFPILLDDDCRTIYEKSAKAASQLLLETLPLIKKGTAPKIHNPSRSYPHYPKRTPEDGLIDFERSALDVYNWVRALTRPYPGAFCFDEKGRKITVWKCAIGKVPGEKHLYRNTLDLPVTLTDWEYTAEG